MEKFPDNDLNQNSFLPGAILLLRVKNVYGKLTWEKFRVKGEKLGSGFAARVYHLVHLESGEHLAVKILKPGFLKFVIALLARFLATFDIAWSEVEVRLGILAREFLAYATKRKFGRERIVPTWRKSYTWINGSFALLLKFHDSRKARLGTLSEAGDREVVGRSNFARELITFLKKIGAGAYTWQFNHTRFEPWGKWYIVLTIVGAIIVLGASMLFDLPYDPKVNVMSWLVLCLTFAGASWMSADNLRFNKRTREFDALDAEFGMPHIALIIPTAGIVGGILYIFHAYLGMSWSWVIFLALCASPGYFFLCEIPRLIANIRAGYPVSFGHIDICEFEDIYGDDPEVQDDIALYKELWLQFESGRLNFLNWGFIRLMWLFGANKYAPLPFSFKEMRLRMIERWALKGIISPLYALRMRNYLIHYWIFFIFSIVGILPWRFIFRIQYCRQRMVRWKARRQEKMLEHKQISYHTALRIASGKVVIRPLQLMISLFLWRSLHRFVFDRHYRRLLIRNCTKVFYSRTFIRRLAVKRFRRYIDEQRNKGRISQRNFERVLVLQSEEQVHSWLVIYYALMAPKPITLGFKILVAAGFVGTRAVAEAMPGLPMFLKGAIERDLAPHLPGFVVGFLLGMGLTAIYEVVATLVLGFAFWPRIIPRTRIEKTKILQIPIFRIIIAVFNILLYPPLAIINGVPIFGSFTAIPGVVSLSKHRFNFWILILVRLRSLVVRFLESVSLGMWEEGGLGDFYFEKFTIGSLAFLPRKLIVLKRRRALAA